MADHARTVATSPPPRRLSSSPRRAGAGAMGAERPAGSGPGGPGLHPDRRRRCRLAPRPAHGVPLPDRRAPGAPEGSRAPSTSTSCTSSATSRCRRPTRRPPTAGPPASSPTRRTASATCAPRSSTSGAAPSSRAGATERRPSARSGSGAAPKQPGRRSRAAHNLAPCASSAACGTPASPPRCALTIGNFDGVHRGHQAMLALLVSEARAPRPAGDCVLTFEPHPRDYFAALRRQARAGAGAHRDPARQAVRARALRRRPGRGAALRRRLRGAVARGLHRRRARRAASARATCWSATTSASARSRAGDYAMLDAAGARARLRRRAHDELRGARPARLELGGARGARAPATWPRPPRCSAGPTASAATSSTAASSAARSARRAGRGDGFARSTCASRTGSRRRCGIFACASTAWRRAARRRRQPRHARRRVDDSGRVLLEMHCLDWPAALGAEGGYGKLVRVELLHKLRDEARYDSLAACRRRSRQDAADARAFLAADARRTPRPAGRRRATEFDRPSRRAPARLAATGDPIGAAPPASRCRSTPAAARKIRHG